MNAEQRIPAIELDFKGRAHNALGDDQLRRNFRTAMDSLMTKRAASFSDADERERLRELGNHIRARALSKLPELLERLEGTPLLLVLDGVTDPHNLGACLRSADAAGVQAVIIPRDRSAGLTPVVRKVACGAAETVPLVAVTNLARTLKSLQQRGLWVVGAAGEAEQLIYQVDMRVPTVIVMGAEGSGLRRLTREHCDYLAKLPMAGSVSSLNVSVATGICLFEAVRQRGTGA